MNTMITHSKLKVGDTIRIVSMQDPYSKLYEGRCGTVTSISKDPWGDLRVEGTWGSIALYPDHDCLVVVERHGSEEGQQC